ncbi:uncharacterized protein VTP21DRAFT_10549 [Calcarisporiella thermophila]|uniref:uncharacterized protein n=1 Tax=Calcarisporiella thermophila TaxID=911321 RepID=UPI0037442830
MPLLTSSKGNGGTNYIELSNREEATHSPQSPNVGQDSELRVDDHQLLVEQYVDSVDARLNYSPRSSIDSKESLETSELVIPPQQSSLGNSMEESGNIEFWPPTELLEVVFDLLYLIVLWILTDELFPT